MAVTLNNDIIGVLGIADAIKPEAIRTIATLREMNIDVWMVTGDHKTTALAIADELDISRNRVVAGALPLDKVTKLESLLESGSYVAMVGDG